MARRDEQPRAVVAAATRIQLDDRRRAQSQAARSQEWQTEAWGHYDEIPEIHESVRYLGNQLGKLRLFVAVDNPEDPDADPVPVTDAKAGVPESVANAAAAVLTRLRSPMGGQAEILRMLNMNLEVPGECYLVKRAEREEQVKDPRFPDQPPRTVVRPDEWHVKSISEVSVKSGIYTVKDGPESGAASWTLDETKGDEVIRVWEKHPQWSNLADSAMRGLLSDCRVLQTLQQLSIGAGNSRQAAGILLVPNELSFGPANPTEPEEGAEAPADPFMAELEDALIGPVNDPSDAGSVMPMVVRGPSEYLKPEVFRHLSLGRDAGDLEAKIEARVGRIARGMNLPVEKVLGHASTTFANAKQIDQDEYEDYLQPRGETLVQALTWAYLRPELEVEPGFPAEWVERVFVWFDPAALIASPDAEANADAAHERNTISDATYRKAKGFSEDDAPTPEELLQRAGLRRGILTADLTLALLELLGVPIDVEALPQPAPTDQPAEDGTEGAARAALLQLLAASAAAGWRRTDGWRGRRPQALEAAARPRPSNDYGQRLVAIDRDLRSRLLVATNDTMGRALDRAANRLRSRATGPLRAKLRDTPNHLVASTGGRALVAEAGTELWAGAWDELEGQFMAWGATAQADALEVASQAAAGLSVAARERLALRQAADLAQAWAWMRESLGALAEARLFDPNPALPALGEIDTTLRVPAGLVRQAVARAGGATSLVAAQDGAWIALTDGGTRPAGGIGTGELVRDALRDGGAMVEAYRWVYGPAMRSRPFLPHQQLDGTVFRNFDDPVLSNGSGFPDGAYYMPGDHTGCICDAEPIIVGADELS